MTTETVYYRFLLRGGTAAALAALNEVPLAREMVVETDTRKFKVGNGVTAYNSLTYWGGSGAGVATVIDNNTGVEVDNTDPANPVLSVSSALLAEIAAKLDDAPSDGQNYTRKDGAWVVASSSGGILPMVNGDVPPALMYFDDGSLLYIQVE